MRIIHVQDLGHLPIPALDLESTIESLCSIAIRKLEHQWLADVAELFLEKKHAWCYLFEKKSTTPTSHIEKYFRSVNTLLSRQLRIIILETLTEFKDFLIQYKDGNSFEGDYQDLTFIRPPFITISVEPIPGTPELRLKPSISDLHSTISRCFDKILKVGSRVPKIESILFPEFSEAGYIFPVSRSESSVSAIINQVLETIKSNQKGPEDYLKHYNDLSYILDGQAAKSLDSYFQIDPIPFLREFGNRIDGYDLLSKEICLFRNKIPLNMMEMDCSIVNNSMRAILHQLRSSICDYFVQELKSNNRELCHVFDEIAEKISGMPETTQEVVDLFNFLVDSRDNTMFSLRSKLARCAELILFLFDYQPPTDEDINLNTRTLTWPKEMETVMELATTRLNMRKEFVEGV